MNTKYPAESPAYPRLDRRSFLAHAAGWISLAALPSRTASGADALRVKGALRIGLTPVFLDEQVGLIQRWRRWLEERLDRPLEFVQRDNYREVVDLLLDSKIDFAWLCSYPYVRHQREMRLVAVPLWQGQPYYRSYLIADANNPGIRSLADLRGGVFAYSDPDSTSGYLYPRYALAQAGHDPAAYFARTFFTWTHKKVIEAVSIGMATGGAVDGYVWEMLSETSPELTQGTRVVERSPLFGFPPFVARRDIPEGDLQHFRDTLLGMSGDAQGAELLARLRLDGFSSPNPDLYDSIVHMAAKVRRL